MKRRFLIGLAPLFAIAAFAMAPVAAQAVTQHWYQNGALATAGEEIPVVTFGQETNLSQLSKLGEINCKGTGGGTVVNPVGGGAGEGKSDGSAFYECHGEPCEKEILTKFGVLGNLTATTENAPSSTQEPAFPGWTNLLEESTVAGTSSIREKIGEPFVTFKTPSPPGMIRAVIKCNIGPGGPEAAKAEFEGELKPEIGVAKAGNLNGTSASVPSQAKFSGPSTGALHSLEGGEGTNTGNVKYLGYFHQEVMTVKP